MAVRRARPSIVASSAQSSVKLPRWRIYAMMFSCVIILGVVILRLFDIQVMRHEQLSDMANREINQQITLQPGRGVITDREGNILAMDVERESLWVVPSLIPSDRAPRLALTLAALLGKDSAEVGRALTSKLYWLPLARWLEPELAEQIAALEEPGLQLVYEPRRIYPQDMFAAHVIGAVNHNGDGISGVESFYNTTLKGITGTLQAEFDGARNPIAIAPQHTQPARDGANLHLTIDPVIQHIAETELETAIAEHQADSGCVIVMEVKTGAIRAMASWPTFNPNTYQQYDPAIYQRNPAVSHLYEPGSTFKIVTVAAGMQARAFTADTVVQDNGVIERYGYGLKNWNGRGNGPITPGQVLYYSSNVGALQLNELTGTDAFYQTVAAFGFGQLSGIDIGGEEAGIVHDSTSPGYDGITLLTNSYGQGISVTPLQMVRAVAAIANDGMLMQPYIVAERCDAAGCVETQPHMVQQVVEPGVAWTVQRMLVHSANHYAPVVWANITGSFEDQWLVPGYEVAAKTGTSSIPLPGGGYDPSYTIGSVAGFAQRTMPSMPFWSKWIDRKMISGACKPPYRCFIGLSNN